MVEPPVVTLASLLRQLRVDAGLTQEELAHAAGLSTRSISDLERGVTLTTRKETARLLADALCLPDAVRATFDAVARGRPVTSTNSALSATVGGAAAATRTLPRDIASFIGREPELRQLVGAASSAGGSGGVVGIHAIGGMAGVGKTAFAVHVAHQLAGRFPDGQIFLSLHGHTPGQRPVNPEDALASLLLTAGVAAAQIPSGLEARMSLWRDHLAGKQLLLLLDDAVGHEQVRPLLPGTAGSLVLITSRRHLTALEDSQAISLDILPIGQAARLLIRLSARPHLHPDDPAVADITRLCGYLPLAVGMLARQLSHHPAWTVAELAADLEAARDRLELMHAENLSVAAAFDLSYQDLTDEQRLLFRRIGLHPGMQLDAYAAAALAGTSAAAARRILDDLYDHYLIAEPARGRYQLHDLIRQHTQAIAATDPASASQDARDRLLDYYLYCAQACDLHLVRRPSAGTPLLPDRPANAPDLSTRKASVAWMRAEYHNLHAAIDYAAAHDRHPHAIATTAAMAGFLRSQGLWPLAITLNQIAVRAARRCGDRRSEAAALVDLGHLQHLAGEEHAAAPNLFRALELFSQLDDSRGEAVALTYIACDCYAEDYPAALASLARALELFRGIGDQLGEANALCELGPMQCKIGDFGGARSTFQLALELFRTVGEPFGEANSLNDLGDALSLLGENAAAIESLEQALEIFRSLGSIHGEANSLGALASVQQVTGDLAAAAANVTRQLGLYRELGNRLWEANSLNTLGSVYCDLGDDEAAAQNLGRALDLYVELGAALGEANARCNMAQVQSRTGQHEAAEANLARALALYRSLGMPDGESQTLNVTGELALAEDDPSRAQAQFERALELAVSIELPLQQARALEGIGRTLMLAGQSDSGRSSLRQALVIYERIGSAAAERVRQLISR